MGNKYKLYPVSRYMLSSWQYKLVTLYEGFGLDNRVAIMRIKEEQCTRVIRRYGKNYYRIEV